MGSHCLAQCLIVLLLVYAESVHSKVFYITPSVDDPCPQNLSCTTISQFAAENNTESEISLLFRPGNHTLNVELYLAHGLNFSMTKDGRGDETVSVQCLTQRERFHVHDAILASIEGIKFIRCGNNHISRVQLLRVTDSTFQDVTNATAVLMLNEIASATILRSYFLANSLQEYNEEENYEDRFFQWGKYGSSLSDYLTKSVPSGVLYAAFSSVSIVNSEFMDNRGDLGGALVAHNSSVFITRSNHSNNTANIGGVMVVSRSSIDIDNSIFIRNTARYSGGVMATYSSIFNISDTAFLDNRAIYGGVISTNDCFFSVRNSVFSFNEHSVLETSSDSITISNSTFSFNLGWQGVIITWGESSVMVTNSIFLDNAAYECSIMCTITGKSSIIFSNNTFTNNTAHYYGSLLRIDDNSSFAINNSLFSNNSGSIMTFQHSNSSFSISNSIFVKNRASIADAVISCSEGTLNINNSIFSLNSNEHGRELISIFQCSAVISNSIFDLNNGSLWIVNSNLTFSGHSKFNQFTDSRVFENSKLGTNLGGGAIKSFLSTVTFARKSNIHFSNNQASRGGAISASDSTIIIYGEMSIVNN